MIKTAVIGATGLVGQKIIRELVDHPWFKITNLVASEKSKGLVLGEFMPDLASGENGSLEVISAEDFAPHKADLIFSALDSSRAGEIELAYARTTPVISTTSAWRRDPFTPLLLCGVNYNHIPLLRVQQKKYNLRGFIAPKPNCTSCGLVLSLKPIYENFGLKKVEMTSLQALSGAGTRPGISGLEIIDNILPYIPGEEEKVVKEPIKILGELTKEGIQEAAFNISATCLRVPVIDGHLLSIAIETKEPTTTKEIKEAIKKFNSTNDLKNLPEAPEELLFVTEDLNRPQPRQDRNRGRAMTVTIGRLRAQREPSVHFKYLALTPNTGIGAGGGAVLNASYLVKHFLKWNL